MLGSMSFDTQELDANKHTWTRSQLTYLFGEPQAVSEQLILERPSMKSPIPPTEGNHESNIDSHTVTSNGCKEFARTDQNAISSTLNMPHLHPPKVKLSPEFRAFVPFSRDHFIDTECLRKLDAETARFLEKKDCFLVPIKRISDTFMRCYFMYFHPLMPLFDEAQFWSSYERHINSSNPDLLSLLEFQSILFVSCAVSLEALIRKT